MTTRATDKIGLENAVFEAEKRLKELTEQTRLKQSTLRDLQQLHKQEVEEASKVLSELKNKISGHRSILKNLKTEVKENRELLKKQEQQIDEAVKNGNEHIMDLQFEANNIEALQTRASYELAQMTQKRDILIKEIQDVQKLSNKVALNYTEENDRYQQLLNGLRERINQAQAELNQVKTQSSNILLSLKAKEEELKKRELAFK